MALTMITKDTVLARCKELLSERPNMTGTEMAIDIAGDFRGGRFSKYAKAQAYINELRREGEI